MPTGSNRRPRGTGRIFQKHGNWYGQWQGLTRKLGPVREPGSREGLTRGMAEARLRERISETANAPPRVTERTTVGDAGRRRIKELARKGRKVDTTLANYESEIRVHFEPYFGETPLSQSGGGRHRGLPRRLLQRRSGCKDRPQSLHPPERRLRVRGPQAVGSHEPVQGGRQTGVGERRRGRTPLPRSRRARGATRGRGPGSLPPLAGDARARREGPIAPGAEQDRGSRSAPNWASQRQPPCTCPAPPRTRCSTTSWLESTGCSTWSPR